VFEHVPDDQRAMAECARVLRRDGLAILSVPLDQTAEKTFVPPPDMSRAERERICGPGHLRLYGMDFEDKLRAAGFAVGRIAFSAEDNETHRLAGEIINICRRAPQA
jgi:SAM-dependent methyltransferase